MKRIGALVCLMVMVVSVLAPASFATNETNSQKSEFKIEKSIPHDKDEGVSVENLSVKIYFNKDVIPTSDSVKKANAKQFKLTDKKGHNIPVKVYYSDKEEGLLMVVSDVMSLSGKDKKNSAIQGDTKYILTIGEKLQAADGTKLGEQTKIEFKTLDQQKSTMVYMILMAIMIVGMVFYTSKAAKKAADKESAESGKSQTVNPYKEAKRTGKSVEEIVAKDKQRKAKEAEALAKKKAQQAEILAALEEEEEAKLSSNKRVSGPKPISATGSEYKVKVVKSQPKKKTSTNPKNQSGKKKNQKNKKK